MSGDLIDSLWIAIALILVIEGIVPFLSPDTFRHLLIKTATTHNTQLRIIGFFSMLSGLALLYWVN